MSSTAVTHETAHVNDVRLHYVTAGEGDPVVLLHGWPQTWYEWREIIPALAEEYRVIAPDMRGLGDSSKPKSGYDKRTVAEDIRLLVDDLGHDEVSLVGHDWGMAVAYAYAAADPESVRRLAVMDALIPGVDVDDAITIWNGTPLWHVRFHMLRDLPEALVSGRERTYLTWFYREAAHDPRAIDEEAIDEYVRCYSAPGGLRAGFEYYRALPQDNEHNRGIDETLPMPVLAFGGEASFGEHPVVHMEAVADDVRGGVIERCGHWIPEERPEYLTEELLDFLAGA